MYLAEARETTWPGRIADRTDPALITLAHHAFDPPLQPFVTSIFSLRCDERRIVDMLPAAVGYLAIVITGRGEIEFSNGRIDQVGGEVLLAPTNAVAAMRVEGPLLMYAAALSPLGWAALTGLDASDHVDRADDAKALLGEDVAALGALLRLQVCRDGFDPNRQVKLIEEFIAPRLRPIDPKYVRLIGKVSEWLSSSLDPPIEQLHREAGYSARQLQRLITRFFGCGPKLLARKYRALRVAALLQAPETDADKADRLIDLFYDQSHLIRELRHFTGATPSRLGELEGSLRTTANNVRNFTEIKPNVAAIPDD